MKLFKLRGGVHPETHKETSNKAIEALPLPEKLYIPLQQHIGAPAELVVKAGEYVLRGQLLARSNGTISAPVHAPSSGKVLCSGLLNLHRTHLVWPYLRSFLKRTVCNVQSIMPAFPILFL